MVLKVDKLSKSYNSKNVLNNVSFSVSKGEIFSIIGKNGTGKSTLVKLISGLSQPDSGLVYYEEKDLINNYSLLKNIEVIHQDICLYLNKTIIDGHAHISDSDYGNVRLLIEEMEKAGVEKTVVVPGGMMDVREMTLYVLGDKEPSDIIPNKVVF